MTATKSVERPALPRLQLHAEKDDAKSKEQVEKSSSTEKLPAYKARV